MQTIKKIERKHGSFKSLVFDVDLAAIGKTHADVEEIFFVIKKNTYDADNDALMLKDKTNDGITIDSNSQVVVPWGATEYTGFTIGKEYVLGLFLKFTGDPVADEDVKQEFKIVITQDLLHDH